MVEAIVHVGVHKTGTSSIQRVMRRYRDRLLEQGFLYPGFAPNHYDIHTAFCSDPLRYHMVRGRGLKTLEEVDELRARVLGSVEQELRESRAPKLLLCSEDIHILDAEELGRFRTWLEGIGVTRTTVFIYLRDHISFWESQVQQSVKGGNVLDLRHEARQLSKMREYRGHLEDLARVFGRQNVRANAFVPDQLAGGDVIVDFAGKVGLDLTDMELVRANESLSRDAMLFLNEMNRRIATYGEHGRSLFRDGLLENLRSHRGEKFRADRATAERIVGRSAEDRAYLKESWFDGADPLGDAMARTVAKLDAGAGEIAVAPDPAGTLDVVEHLYRGLKAENLKLSADRFRLKGLMKRDEDPQRSKEFLEKSRRLKRELQFVAKGE